MPWISIREYCKKKGIKNTQVIYNKIAMNKFKGKHREVEVTIKRKQVFL